MVSLLTPGTLNGKFNHDVAICACGTCMSSSNMVIGACKMIPSCNHCEVLMQSCHSSFGMVILVNVEIFNVCIILSSFICFELVLVSSIFSTARFELILMDVAFTVVSMELLWALLIWGILCHGK